MNKSHSTVHGNESGPNQQSHIPYMHNTGNHSAQVLMPSIDDGLAASGMNSEDMNASYHTAYESVPNIIVFGETGTGKSSLINMIAGEPLAGISNEALGCTFDNQNYDVVIDGLRYRMWDTAGLNEGEQGIVPADLALDKLRELVENLEEGVNLLVYCIRGSRFRDILKMNYDLFTDIICDGKVPVAVVITGLENESPMEAWWEENSQEFELYNMSFVGHACVTTTRGKKMKNGGHMFDEEYAESEAAVRQLIVETCPAVPWKSADRNWLDAITQRITRYYDMYNRTTRTSHSLRRQEENSRTNDSQQEDFAPQDFADFAMTVGWELIKWLYEVIIMNNREANPLQR